VPDPINDVGVGWRPIVSAAVEAIGKRQGFITQIKEKFGGLRIYVHGGDYDAIDDIIRTAERECAITCEICGKPGTLRNLKGWLKTACEEHGNELEAKTK
jgi:hypothetical protein